MNYCTGINILSSNWWNIPPFSVPVSGIQVKSGILPDIWMARTSCAVHIQSTRLIILFFPNKQDWFLIVSPNDQDWFLLYFPP
jgi:hypothetical protein